MRKYLPVALLLLLLTACSGLNQNDEQVAQPSIAATSMVTQGVEVVPDLSETISVPPTESAIHFIDDFPLSIGSTWIYSAEITYQDPLDSTKLNTWTGVITDKVIDSQELSGGVRVITVHEDLQPSPPEGVWRQPGNFEYTLSGNRISKGNMVILEWPVSNQMKWKVFADFEYEALAQIVDELQTPYGYFKSCYDLLFASRPDITTETYCPGTGFVKHTYRHNGSVQIENFILTNFEAGK